MVDLRNGVIALMAAGFAFQAVAAFAESPSAAVDWPCKQVRVPDVALAGVWSGPAIGAGANVWRNDPAIADLVSRLRLRRTPLPEAERLVAAFATAAGEQRRARLLVLFGGVYEAMNDERHQVVAGLDRFGRRLRGMAEEARAATDAMRAIQDRKPPPDPEEIRKASEALQWRLRLFEENRRMVSYVCESPALIEQRLGALARIIASAME
jgi:hypothetical protein